MYVEKLALIGALILSGCFSAGGGGGGGFGTGTLQGDAAEAYLSEAVFIPNEGSPLQDPETDDSVSIQPSGGSSSGAGAQPGSMLSVSIPFDAPNGDVVAAGIRFGDSGPIRTVPVPGAGGQNSGTLQFDVGLPSDLCSNLSGICHDIKCYEFAVTSAGRVSRANINSVAVQCGNCNEPSCQDLLDDCALLPDDPPPTTDLGVICSGAPVGCPSGASLDFCVDTNTMACWYQVGSQRVNCGTCATADQFSVTGCVEQAVALCQ